MRVSVGDGEPSSSVRPKIRSYSWEMTLDHGFLVRRVLQRAHDGQAGAAATGGRGGRGGGRGGRDGGAHPAAAAAEPALRRRGRCGGELGGASGAGEPRACHVCEEPAAAGGAAGRGAAWPRGGGGAAAATGEPDLAAAPPRHVDAASRRGRRLFTALAVHRHGYSAWNEENRFTGWADPPLTSRGREEARLAGSLLREAGVRRVERVFCSLHERAIKTAWPPARRGGDLGATSGDLGYSRAGVAAARRDGDAVGAAQLHVAAERETLRSSPAAAAAETGS